MGDQPQAAELSIGENHHVEARALLLFVVPLLVFLLHVVEDAHPQVLVEQEPLGDSGEDPAGIGRAPFHPDVLHMVGKQLLTPKVLKLLGLLHALVCQEVLNLIKER